MIEKQTRFAQWQTNTFQCSLMFVQLNFLVLAVGEKKLLTKSKQHQLKGLSSLLLACHQHGASDQDVHSKYFTVHVKNS